VEAEGLEARLALMAIPARFFNEHPTLLGKHLLSKKVAEIQLLT
jgi:hypothetical protein